MPKSTEEILAHAEELATKFEAVELSPLELSFAAELASVHKAVVNRAAAEKGLVEAIRDARQAGATWQSLGTILGTSGEAARQRFGKLAA